MTMQAHGADGVIAANDSHITITWTTLRGRMSSLDGSNVEVVPISQIFETLLIPAKAGMKGCLQFNLIGSQSSLAFEENWMSSLRIGNLHHAVLFNHPSQFEFKALADHIKGRITHLRRLHPLDGGFGTSASKIG
ncbi:unannotated protein [freshwater metagenome]|uniref:Unannotated protein n=1 Tax=freshwater metagenome TaxID=449393 RepID=A0A6J6PKV2_9ZZZZ|nr:hypothetical protein [Actinomycetota bacterium]